MTSNNYSISSRYYPRFYTSTIGIGEADIVLKDNKWYQRGRLASESERMTKVEQVGMFQTLQREMKEMRQKNKEKM